ncbi:MAG TPA: PHP domain-containing protein [Deltaproteobacteria bacterium]|nr:PHP domain-containing protein [Deltaproteobacteria bacterium]
MLIDIHVHTTFSSCSDLKIDDILENALSRGLDGVCITDHNTMDAAKVVSEGIQDNGLCVIIGMEYDTPEGDFLIFGPFEDIRPGMSAQELLHNVHSSGGVAIAAHPLRAERPVSERVLRGGMVDAVEAVNARNSDLENAKMQAWLRRHPHIQSGGSDAHSLTELGSVATSIGMPVKTREDFIFAVKSGLCAPVLNVQQQPCVNECIAS